MVHGHQKQAAGSHDADTRQPAMLRFVQSDSAGLPLKRKQVAQACDPCRKRKKRCIHVDERVVEGHSVPEVPDQSREDRPRQDQTGSLSSSPASSSAAPANVRLTSAPRSPVPSPGLKRSKMDGDAEDKSTSRRRFFGDLNPVGMFIEATSPSSSRDLSVRGSGVGVWQNAHRRLLQDFSDPQPPGPVARPFPSLSQVIQDHKAQVRAHCLPCRPPPADATALRRIYMQRLAPIFPVIDDAMLDDHPDITTRTVLWQVVSLAAASDPEAESHLRLGEGGPLLSRQEFCASLSPAIQTTLDASLIPHRAMLTRILLAFSLYVQPTDTEEADLASLLFSRAVHQMHTLGLHMDMPPEAGAEADFKHRESAQTLFCCLWALDRLNASFYGRACLIHEPDIGWNLDECIDAQSPLFRLFLRVVGLLDEVFNLYRPGTRTTDEGVVANLPIFEQMVIDAGAVNVSSSFLATLEILYHSVSILSCKVPSNANGSALPVPGANSRRSLSADRITAIVGQEYFDQLSYMPIIPYAISLSLSVAYRKMRYSKLPMYRQRGKEAFRTNTNLLKSLSDTFWTARTMAAMAEQVLQQLDKATASLVAQQQDNSSTRQTRASRAPGGDGAQEPHSVYRQAVQVATPSSSSDRFPIESSGSIPSQHTGAYMGGEGNNNMGSAGQRPFAAPPDFDVFGYMDPSFNLNAADAVLEGNLDFGASSNWFDWQQVWGTGT